MTRIAVSFIAFAYLAPPLHLLARRALGMLRRMNGDTEQRGAA